MPEQKKILIVEDDKAVRVVLGNEMKRLGYAIFEAENGEAAVALALIEHPDLILLDVVMPKMHGIEMLRKLQEDMWGKTVPIVLLTNFADDPEVVQAVQEGRCEVLSKSDTKLDDILNKVHEKIGE